MKRQSVDSTSLASIGYDAETSTLEVAFRHGGVYRYFGVPARVHHELLTADSMGNYLVHSIKPTYPVERVDR